jgi:uncharacterized protein (TIGR00369 family)
MQANSMENLTPPHGGSTAEWTDWAESLPVSRAMGLRCTKIEHGKVTVLLESVPWPLNPNGAVHGGMVLAWADHCLGLVGSTVVDPGSVPATATLTSEFLRPAVPPLTFEAEVDRCGKTTVFITVRVHDAKGRLSNKVSGTMSIDGTSRFVAP